MAIHTLQSIRSPSHASIHSLSLTLRILSHPTTPFARKHPSNSTTDFNKQA